MNTVVSSMWAFGVASGAEGELALEPTCFMSNSVCILEALHRREQERHQRIGISYPEEFCDATCAGLARQAMADEGSQVPACAVDATISQAMGEQPGGDQEGCEEMCSRIDAAAEMMRLE